VSLAFGFCAERGNLSPRNRRKGRVNTGCLVEERGVERECPKQQLCEGLSTGRGARGRTIS
jgi:hypothetical protein